MAKKINKKLISGEDLKQEFDNLCKKYKLPNALLVIETLREKVDKDHDNVALFVGVHSRSKKREQALAAPVKKLFTLASLSPGALTMAAEFMEKENERQKLYRLEKNLSKEDKLKLIKIRSDKNECVLNKEYEKASKLREKELKLLGIKPEKNLTPLDLDEVMNYKPTPDDLRKISEDLIGKLKGWTIVEPGK